MGNVGSAGARKRRLGMPALGFAALAGCGDAPVAPPPPGCAAGEWPHDDGSCVAAGLPPDLPCPPGSWEPEPGGGCVPAGVPPGGCEPGFEHDGDGGCTPVLPAGDCPSGQMALPGETRCREVAP